MELERTVRMRNSLVTSFHKNRWKEYDGLPVPYTVVSVYQ